MNFNNDLLTTKILTTQLEAQAKLRQPSWYNEETAFNCVQDSTYHHPYEEKKISDKHDITFNFINKWKINIELARI